MSQKSPAFQFYPRDWLCSLTVMRMTGDQVKAYMYLLCASWLNEPRATLSSDDSELCAMAHLSLSEWMDIKIGVMKAFKFHNGRFISERLLSVSNLQEKNKENIEKRWSKYKKNTKHHTKSIPNAIPNTVPRHEDEDEDEEADEREVEDEDDPFLDNHK